MPDMSSSSEIYENSVQVVENLIDSDLIDKAVAELQLGATSATDEIITRMNWITLITFIALIAWIAGIADCLIA